MKKHIIGLLFLFTAPLFANQNYSYIISDIANVRNVSEQSGSIVARLVCGTMVVIADSTENWYKIHYSAVNNNPSDDKQLQTGWVHRSTLSSKPLVSSSRSASNVSVFDEFKHAKNLTDSILWLERCWTYREREGGDSAIRSQLISCYIRAGDTTRLNWIKNQSSIYLVKGHGKTLRVLGTIDTKGEFTSLIWPVLDREAWEEQGNTALARLACWIQYDITTIAAARNWLKQVDRIRLEIAALRWYGVGGGCMMHFPNPFFTPTDNKTVNETLNLPIYLYGAIGALLLDTVDYRSDGLLYCSRKTSWIDVCGPKESKDWTKIFNCVSQLSKGIKTGVETMDMGSTHGITNIRAWFLPDGKLDLTIEAPFLYGKLMCQYARGIFGSDGTLLWPKKYCQKEDGCRLETNYFPSDLEREQEAFTPYDPSPRWFQIDGIPDYYYAVMRKITSYYPDEKNVCEGEVLVRIGPGGVKSWKIWSISDIN